MKKILFCQFHNYLINGKSTKTSADKYYNGIYQYREADGYYKNNSFFELPLWIAEICGSIKNHFNSELLIIDNLKKSLYEINKSKPDYILFSVLDVNKKYIFDIVKNYRGNAKIILGGYTNLNEFKQFKNVSIFNSVKDFILSLNINYNYNLNYDLFKNYKTVPRLTLSTGCLNYCKFCTVKKQIKTTNKKDIVKQIKAFKALNFKLVYLNDKTFGQAKNYYLLPLIYKHIKKYNPDFKGFIVQTTATQILNTHFIAFLKNSKIFACEIGMETYNDVILKDLKKPHNTLLINKAIEVLKNNDVKIILNVIIGFLNENKKTYNNTLNFIKKNISDVYLLNIYNLAVYTDTELSKGINTNNDEDLNENNPNKSFYSKKQLKNNKYFSSNIFKIGLKILQGGKK